MSGDRVEFRRIRYRDPNIARYYEDGCTALPEERAEEEVMAGLADYVTEESRATPETVREKVETPQAAGHFLQRKGFLPDSRFTRVAWVQDYSRRGGAEISSETVVRVGELCGFDIVGVTPNTYCEDVLRAADIVVLGNCHEFTLSQFDMIRRWLFECRKPYVKYEHDYRELRRDNISRQLFTCARLNVFISPRHLAGHAHLMDAEARSRCVALPLAVDVDQFPEHPMTAERAAVCLVPTARKAGPGLIEYVRAHQDKHYIVLGQMHAPLPARHVEYLRGCAPEQMPELYARAGVVVHLPDQPWAGERVVLEARLSGCEVVANDNVGHVSWEWWTESDAVRLRARLRAAPYQFWRMVEKAILRRA